MDKLKIFYSIIKEEGKALLGAIKNIDNNIEKAIDEIVKSRGKIIISGVGKSGIIGLKIASTFTSTGRTAISLHPADAAHGDIGVLNKKDLLIVLSFGGNQKEFEFLYDRCNTLAVPIIGITGNSDSNLYRRADIPILLPVKKEVSIYPFIPSISSTLTLAIGDGLALTCAKLRDFQPEDFAKLHPGGILGVLLNKKIENIMHKDKDIPFLFLKSQMKDILYTVSSHRLGAGIVINNKKELLGVITDGDLRRTFEKYGKQAFDLQTEEIMTKKPLFVQSMSIAKEALDIMEEKKITALPVLKNNMVVGILHLHDILGGNL